MARRPGAVLGLARQPDLFRLRDGGIYLGGSEYLNDDGAAINADVRFAWSNFGSVQKKNFKMVRLYSITDGLPRPFIDLEVDYNNVPPDQPAGNHRRALGRVPSGTWRRGTWTTGRQSTQPKQNWQGVTGLGRVGAARVRVSVSGATFSLTGVDVLYELGGLM